MKELVEITFIVRPGRKLVWIKVIAERVNWTRLVIMKMFMKRLEVPEKATQNSWLGMLQMEIQSLGILLLFHLRDWYTLHHIHQLH